MECLETSILGTPRRWLPVPHSPPEVYTFITYTNRQHCASVSALVSSCAGPCSDWSEIPVVCGCCRANNRFSNYDSRRERSCGSHCHRDLDSENLCARCLRHPRGRSPGNVGRVGHCSDAVAGFLETTFQALPQRNQTRRHATPIQRWGCLEGRSTLLASYTTRPRVATRRKSTACCRRAPRTRIG